MQIKDLIPWARKDSAPESRREEGNPIASLQQEMNRVFENFWNRLGHLDWPWGSGEAKSSISVRGVSRSPSARAMWKK